MTLEWLPVYRQNEIIEMKCFNILVLAVAEGYFRPEKKNQISNMEKVSFIEKDTVIFVQLLMQHG